MIIFLLLDGIYDEKIKEFNYRTPLEIANTTGIDEISKNSKYLMVRTSYEGFPVGSIVANLGLLGYDPRKYYPYGRSVYEILARKKFDEINENDLLMRLNYVRLDENKKMIDFTGGQINDKIALELTNYLNEKIDNDYEIVHGKSYRNSIIIKNTILKCEDIITFEPHMNRNEFIEKLLIKPNKELSSEKLKEIEKLNILILDSHNLITEFMIKNYPDTKANSICLWGQSYKKQIPPIIKINGNIKKGVIINGSDFLEGIGQMAGLETYTEDSFTGEIDTNLEGKFLKTKEYIEKNYDFIFLHINALDEAAHILDPVLKKNLIEKIDKEIILPIYEIVKNKENVNVVIMGDHYTSSISGKHLAYNVPALIWRKDNKINNIKFDENIKINKIIDAYELLRNIEEI